MKMQGNGLRTFGMVSFEKDALLGGRQSTTFFHTFLGTAPFQYRGGGTVGRTLLAWYEFSAYSMEKQVS